MSGALQGLQATRSTEMGAPLSSCPSSGTSLRNAEGPVINLLPGDLLQLAFPAPLPEAPQLHAGSSRQRTFMGCRSEQARMLHSDAHLYVLSPLTSKHHPLRGERRFLLAGCPGKGSKTTLAPRGHEGRRV